MADYYGSVAGFDSYCADHGYTTTGDTNAKIIALRVASVWLDGRYGARFAGNSGQSLTYAPNYSGFDGTFKTGGRTQLREWPRIGVVDIYGYSIGSTEIPREVEQATYEAAFRQSMQPGSLFVDFTKSKAYKSVSISGAIAVEYATINDATDVQLVVPIIDAILYPLIGRNSGKSSGLSGDAIRV